MSAEAVKVVVRCRPLNDREKKLKSEVIVGMDSAIIQVQLTKPKTPDAPPKQFTFDGVYFIDNTTKQIYEDICFSLVRGVLEGYNGTVFAYGQTGCGKSYTMMGVEDPPENRGIIPRAFQHIFDHIGVNTSVKYLVRASYLEIYNEEVRDLIGKDAKKRLDLHEHPEKGVYVKNLSYHKVHDVSNLERVMQLGSENRSVGATLMNVDSSRSHSIFSIDIEMLETVEGSEKLRAGRLNLVDLAGSERQAKTGATGDRLKEATKINLSLSALGNVISALVDGKSKHIPYRDSKLTRLLQTSLGGNTKTLMVACISPADNNFDETLSTLRYANRAKNIKNKPKINEDPKDALLREYQEEIQKLKMMLTGQIDVPKDINFTAPQSAHRTTSQRSIHEENFKNWEKEKEDIKKEYEAQINELQGQFGREQEDKTKLQSELEILQEEWDQKLKVAEGRLNSGGSVPAKSSQEAVPQKGEEADPTTTTLQKESSIQSIYSHDSLDKDKSILKEHDMAVKRLEELQNEMMGGEKADNEELKQDLEDRQQAAEEKETQIVRASSLFEDEDDNVMERIFNSLTDEVRVKTQVLERNKTKLLSMEEDIKDLQSEFEIDRQDYLDTIRNQDKTIKLLDELLGTVVPCLRRDCNYFNIDKIKLECKWDEDNYCWNLPRLILNKTVLASPSPSQKVPGELRDRRGHGNTKQGGSSTEINIKASSSSLLRGYHAHAAITHEPNEEDKYLSHLQRSEESLEYFKPKRALELLGQSHSLGKEVSSSPAHDSGSQVKISGSLSALPNAAFVHGVDPHKDSKYGSRRPGKLQSLSRNPPVPQPYNAVPQPDILEKVEKKISTRKKNNLEPISDIKKPPL